MGMKEYIPAASALRWYLFRCFIPVPLQSLEGLHGNALAIKDTNDIAMVLWKSKCVNI